ncbi:NUDIX hydrolase [Actinoplanes sp. NPDC049596]|uniref:NUDIX hydrolase n=1 Tax=unclassified Actinoplanes TaxID=2626549 RepID=UPI0034240F9C
MTFQHRTVSSTSRYKGPIFEVFSEEVTMSGGGTAQRDVVRNRGAVGIVALDEVDRVVLIRQYRHAVGQRLWELPAGLRDVEGEEPLTTAARELAEEADVDAARWDLLIDMYNSPGFSDETIRIFLARDLTEVPDDKRYSRTDEEADLEITRVDLDEAVAMVFRGEITNAAAVGGLLAAARARDEGWATLRPA